MVGTNKMSSYSPPFARLLELNNRYPICEKNRSVCFHEPLSKHRAVLSTRLLCNLLLMLQLKLEKKLKLYGNIILPQIYSRIVITKAGNMK